MIHLRTVEWQRFVDADEAWRKELTIAFGDNASFEGYYGDPALHPEAVQAAFKKREAARTAASKLVYEHA